SREKIAAGEQGLRYQQLMQALTLANRPKPVSYSPGSIYGRENPATGEFTQTGQVPFRPETPSVDQQELQDYLKKNPGKGPAEFAAYKATLGQRPEYLVVRTLNAQGQPVEKIVPKIPGSEYPAIPTPGSLSLNSEQA